MIKNQDKIAEKQTSIANAKAKLREALDNSLKPKRVEPEQPAPVEANITSAENTTASQTNSSSSSDSKSEPKDSFGVVKDGKLNDQQVAQVIDEVSIEQEAQEDPALKKKPMNNDDKEFQGFIGKYTRKVSGADDEPAQ